MSDLNDRIARAKGWTWDEELYIRTKPGAIPHYDRWLQEDLIEKETTHWINPEGEPVLCPDFIGTLEGVAGMLRELNEAYSGVLWTYNIYRHRFECIIDDGVMAFSPDECPGDCVGESWMSLVGKEAC